MDFFPQPSGPPDPSLLEPAKVVRTSQIICVAMIMGVSMFLGIVLISPGKQVTPPTLSYIGAGGALLMIGLQFVVLSVFVNSQKKRFLSDQIVNLDGQLFSLFQTKMIIGLAMLEGAAFFNLVANMVERQWWSLAVVGVLLFLMAISFPTFPRVESWVQDLKRDLQNQF